MSMRHPPTPPLSKAPLRPGKNPTRKPIEQQTPNIQKKSSRSPFRSRSREPAAQLQDSTPPTPPRNLLQVHNAEPQAYWSGRLCALADRYRNEELARQLSGSSHTPKSQTDKMHTLEASDARIYRAFEYLHTMCATAEAKDSLTLFQYQYADMMKMPELRKMAPIVLGSGGSKDSVAVGAGTEGSAAVGMSESRRMTFVNRLLGRPKRRSLVLA
jgi:hypothetical protein